MMRPAILALIGIASCSSPEPARTPHVPADSAIYAAVLDSLRGQASRVTVVRQFVPPRAMDDSGTLRSWLLGQSPMITAPLLDALERRAARTPDVESALGSEPGVVYRDSSSSESDSVSRSAPGRQIRFSNIGWSTDSASAILYASMQCGALCGQGSYYVVARGPDGHWRIVAQVVRFVS